MREYVPDNYDMFKAYDREIAKQEEEAIHCYCCGEPIYEGDKYYEINGEAFCKSCLDDYFGKFA